MLAFVYGMACAYHDHRLWQFFFSSRSVKRIPVVNGKEEISTKKLISLTATVFVVTTINNMNAAEYLLEEDKFQ